jgi:hypothetical protein
MPRRPPKKWWYKNVRNVKRWFPEITDPDRFVAWAWYHNLKPGTKKTILSKELLGGIVKKYKKKKARKARKARKTIRRQVKRSGLRRVVSKRKKSLKRVMKHKKRKNIFKKEGASMAKKRRHHKRRYHGLEGIGIGRKHRRRARRGILMGGAVQDIAGSAINVASGVAGGVAGAYVVNMIPITNPRVRNLIPFLGGAIIATMMKQPALKMAGLGLGIFGGYALLKSFVPALPSISGDTLMLAPEYQRAIADRSMGDPVTIPEMAGDTWQSQAAM